MEYSLQKKMTRFITALGLTMTLSACAHSDCNINGQHVHMYKNPVNGISIIMNSEKEQIGDFHKTDDTRPITELEKFVIKHQLINVADCDSTFIDEMLNKSPYYKEEIKNGKIQTYYVSYNYRFLQISYDNQTGKYFLVEQYVKDITERLPGFNYFQEGQFIFEDYHPVSSPILK